MDIVAIFLVSVMIRKETEVAAGVHFLKLKVFNLEILSEIFLADH